MWPTMNYMPAFHSTSENSENMNRGFLLNGKRPWKQQSVIGLNLENVRPLSHCDRTRCPTKEIVIIEIMT